MSNELVENIIKNVLKKIKNKQREKNIIINELPSNSHVFLEFSKKSSEGLSFQKAKEEASKLFAGRDLRDVLSMLEHAEISYKSVLHIRKFFGTKEYNKIADELNLTNY